VQVPTPDRLKEVLGGYENLQFTLVDCPGHASLIRTIIGGECGQLQTLTIGKLTAVPTGTAEFEPQFTA
jgi:selenocysteine-specific elongation factor